MKLSIIIPTYNRKTYLEKTIESILQQTFSTFEIIVIDNGPSTDDTSILFSTRWKHEQRIKYFQVPNQGVIYARNYGVKKSSGNIIVLMDDDVELLSNNTFDILVETYRTNSKIAIIGAIEVHNKDYPIPSPSKTVPKNIGRISQDGLIDTSYDTLFHSQITEVDHVRSAFLATTKKAYVQVDGFDEIYHFHSYDFRYETDFAVKVKRLGYSVVVNPKIIVWHKVAPRQRASKSRTSLEYAYYSNRNHILFMLRHYWKKDGLAKVFKDIKFGQYKAPGLYYIYRRFLIERNFKLFAYGLFAIIGKIMGYLRYRKYEK